MAAVLVPFRKKFLTKAEMFQVSLFGGTRNFHAACLATLFSHAVYETVRANNDVVIFYPRTTLRSSEVRWFFQQIRKHMFPKHVLENTTFPRRRYYKGLPLPMANGQNPPDSWAEFWGEVSAPADTLTPSDLYLYFILHRYVQEFPALVRVMHVITQRFPKIPFDQVFTLVSCMGMYNYEHAPGHYIWFSKLTETHLDYLTTYNFRKCWLKMSKQSAEQVYTKDFEKNNYVHSYFWLDGDISRWYFKHTGTILPDRRTTEYNQCFVRLHHDIDMCRRQQNSLRTLWEMVYSNQRVPYDGGKGGYRLIDEAFAFDYGTAKYPLLLTEEWYNVVRALDAFHNNKE